MQPRATVAHGACTLGHRRLVEDYFDDNPRFSPDVFRRRFRMGRDLFLRIANAVAEVDPYFQQRPDAAGTEGIHE